MLIHSVGVVLCMFAAMQSVSDYVCEFSSEDRIVTRCDVDDEMVRSLAGDWRISGARWKLEAFHTEGLCGVIYPTPGGRDKLGIIPLHDSHAGGNSPCWLVSIPQSGVSEEWECYAAKHGRLGWVKMTDGGFVLNISTLRTRQYAANFGTTCPLLGPISLDCKANVFWKIAEEHSAEILQSDDTNRVEFVNFREDGSAK